MNDYPIIDGFSFKRKLRCNLTFLSLAVAEFEALRRAGSFRTKQWCVPQDANSFPIPARDSYEYQLQMIPGSAIWGYTFVGDAGGAFTLCFQVRDTCDDFALFSEPITRQLQANPPQQLLSKLLIVGAPGLLNIEIASTYPTEQLAQLILYGGEPVYGY